MEQCPKTGRAQSPRRPPIPGGLLLVLVAVVISGSLSAALIASPAFAMPGDGHAFADYVPKNTEDTVLDYRPELAGRLAELPEVTTDNVVAAIAELRAKASAAASHPGHWEPGHIALGGDPREYVPSDEELIAAELGDRVGNFMTRRSVPEMTGLLSEMTLQRLAANYTRFTFRHVDVMGSGRFFYASAPQWATVLTAEAGVEIDGTIAERLIETGPWTVICLKDQLLDPRADESGPRPTMEFQPADLPGQVRVSGNSSCNSYFGDMRIDGDRISLQSVGQTKRACLVGMALEFEFLHALKEAARAEFLGPRRVVIADHTDAPVLLLVPTADL